MRVPGPNILVVRRPPPFREGRDLDHHVPAYSEGARACWGGGDAGSCFWSRPPPCWGGGVGAAKGLLPSFLVPKRNQPTPCTLALWWLKFGPTEGSLGGGGRPGGGGGPKVGGPARDPLLRMQDLHFATNNICMAPRLANLALKTWMV